MATQESYKEDRRRKTTHAAHALVDDLSYFRRLLSSEEITSGDIRRMSAQLRRILVDETLQKVASPRVGKIKLLSIDTAPWIKVNKVKPYMFFGMGPVTIFGYSISAVAINSGPTPDDIDVSSLKANFPVSVEEFTSQGAIVMDGTWITRRSLIKYIANVAEGVHSGSERNNEEILIRRARSVSSLSFESDLLTINNNTSVFSNDSYDEVIDKNNIDWVLIELFTAASLLTSSPDVHTLEKYINEYG